MKTTGRGFIKLCGANSLTPHNKAIFINKCFLITYLKKETLSHATSHSACLNSLPGFIFLQMPEVITLHKKFLQKDLLILGMNGLMNE